MQKLEVMGELCGQTCQEYMRRYFAPGDETFKGELYAGDKEGWEALDKELQS